MESIDLQLVALLIAVSFVIMQLIEALIKPIVTIVNKAIQHQPVLADVLDLWPVYVSVIIGGGLIWFTEFNLFGSFWPSYPVIGRVITSLAGGLGPTFVYDLIHKAPQATVTT